MLLSAYDEFVKPTMRDPVTGLKIKEKDVVTLVAAASSYSASGNVESKMYRPTIT
jgi:hypothetical protein